MPSPPGRPPRSSLPSPCSVSASPGASICWWSPPSARRHAALLGAQVALLGIYLSSTIVRTLLRGFTFTWFETAQCAAAFLISVGGGLQLTSADARVAPALALLSLVCAAACYLVSFLMLDRGGALGRNFHT